MFQNQLIGAGASRGGPDGVHFTEGVGDSSNASADFTNNGGFTVTKTKSGVDIGDAYPDRMIIAAVKYNTWYYGNGTLDYVSINGTNMNVLYSLYASGGEDGLFLCYLEDASANTTADIVVASKELSGTSTKMFHSCVAEFWAIYGRSTTPYDSATDYAAASVVSLAIDCPAGGVVIAGGGNRRTGALTQSYFDSLDLNYRAEANSLGCGFSKAYGTAQTNLDVDYHYYYVHSTNSSVCAVASWA